MFAAELTVVKSTAAETPASPVAAAPAAGAMRFLGSEVAYWRLRLKGAALVLVTLGLYRFWLATDVRRFLWANTELAGDTLEYNGLATELVVGFLLAIAIVVPLYTLLAIFALDSTVAAGAVAGGLLLVAFLSQFAFYRARRYRLTRTVFRGVRFDQHGSAWNYALRALIWWTAVIATLGLAYPWAQATLQRFKMRHTCYGDLPGRFDGSGTALFARGLPIWVLVVGPLIAGAGALAELVDWDALSNALSRGDDAAMDRLIATDTQFGLAVGIAFVAVTASVLAAALLLPLLRAVLLRWWISGLAFGTVTVTSRLRTAQVYRVYLRFVLYLALFALAALGLGLGSASVLRMLFRAASYSDAAGLAASALTLCLYVLVVLGASTIYQVTVSAALWRLGVQSAELAGAAALDNVRASGAASSALGEGLVDALRVGGI